MADRQHAAEADQAPQGGLRILLADEDEEALRGIAAILADLGHRVTSVAVGPREAAERVADDDPDVAVVMLHEDDEHALRLIDEISSFASGPVLALLESEDPDFIEAAAQRGIFGYVRPITAVTLQSAIEVAVRRHAELANLSEQVDQLEGALARRAVIERAKGILMERHTVDEGHAFALLRDHARSHNQRIVELARAVVDGHALLPSRSASP